MQIIHLFFILSMFVLACGQSSAPSGGDSMMQAEMAPSPSMEKMAADESGTLPRKKIRNGQLRLRVDDTRAAAEDIRQIILGSGGEIQDEQENSYDRTQEVYMTVRVSANLLDSIMNILCGHAEKVENRSVSESDITEVYADTDARLIQKRALEKRYLEILQQARNVEDMLAIERELNQVRSDIESMDGQMRLYDKQVAMSTLVVSLVTVQSGVNNFFSELGDAFGRGWTLLQQLFLFLASGWAVILFVGATFWLFRRWRRNRRPS